MLKFEENKTYQTRSICDHDCIISIKVAKRTAKTITTDEGKLFRISIWDDKETIKPYGSYSMAPIIRADCIAAGV